MTEPADRVEVVVRRYLEDITKIPSGRILLSDRLVDDLNADGDDLSFLFIPGVEGELGVKVAHHVWMTVFTVQDAIDALSAAQQEQHVTTEQA